MVHKEPAIGHIGKSDISWLKKQADKIIQACSQVITKYSHQTVTSEPLNLCFPKLKGKIFLCAQCVLYSSFVRQRKRSFWTGLTWPHQNLLLIDLISSVPISGTRNISLLSIHLYPGYFLPLPQGKDLGLKPWSENYQDLLWRGETFPLCHLKYLCWLFLPPLAQRRWTGCPVFWCV